MKFRGIIFVMAICYSSCGQPAKVEQRLQTSTAGVAPSTRTSIDRAISGPMGGVGPIVLKDADPLERWVVYCQAREDSNGDGNLQIDFGHHGAVFGDELSLYLNLKEGGGEKIKRFWARDTRGSNLLIEDEGGIFLVNVPSGYRTGLESLGGIRYKDERSSPASFDEHGRVLFHREENGMFEFVLRDIHSGDEILTPTKGKNIIDAHITKSGAWILFQDVEKDTDGNGVIDVPRTRTTRAMGACTGPAMSYSTYGYSGDAPVTRALPVSGNGRSVVLSGPYFVLQDKLLISNKKGGLSIVDAALNETEIVPASCKAEVLAVHSTLERVLVGCADTMGAHQAWIYGLNFSRNLGFQLAPDADAIVVRGDDEVPVTSFGRELLVNFSKAVARNSCDKFELLDGELHCSGFSSEEVSCRYDARACASKEYPIVLDKSGRGGRLVAESSSESMFGGTIPHGSMRWIKASRFTSKKVVNRDSAIDLPLCEKSSTSLCVVDDSGVGDRIWARSDTELWSAKYSKLLHFSKGRWALAKKRDDPITDIAGTPDGQVWVAIGQEIQQWDGKSFRPRVKLPAEITALHASGNRSVWAVGKGGMVQHLSPNGWRALPSPGTGMVRKVFTLSDKSAWVVLANGSLTHWNGKRWEKAPGIDVGDSAQIWGCAENDIWASNFNGTLFHWDGKSWQSTRPFGKSNIWSIHGNTCDQVWATESTDHGQNIFKSENARLWRWEGSKWSQITEVPSLSQVNVTSTSVWISNSSANLRLPLP